jgi:hypothetical protein
MARHAPSSPLILFVACATSGPPPRSGAARRAAWPYGSEEAPILALEDRREHNAEVVNAWVAHRTAPPPAHRLALGRIGAITKTGVPN